MKSLNALEVLSALSQKKIRIFSPEEFRRLFRVTQRAAQVTLGTPSKCAGFELNPALLEGVLISVWKGY